MIEKPAQILIVEDDPAQAQLIVQAFKTKSPQASVNMARTIREARIRIQETIPMLVISDLKLPDGLGIELLPGAGVEPNMPIIIMTCQGDEESAVEAMKSGAIDYIVKSGTALVNMPETAQRILREWEHILARREAEEAMRISQQRMDLAFKGANLAMWDWDLTSDECAQCERWAAMLGFSLDELEPTLGFWQTLIHPDDKEHVLGKLNDHIEQISPEYEAEFRMRTRDGGWKWVLMRGRVLERDKNGSPLRIAGTYRDISNRKKADQELARMAAIISQMDEIVITADLGGKIEYINQAYERISGFTSSQVIGRYTSDFYWGVDDDRLAEIRCALALNNKWSGRMSLKKKDGSIFDVDVRIWRMRMSSDTECCVSIARDVTEQLLMEAQLRQSQKLESIGQLAAGIAHEINTPMQYINDNTRYLKESFNSIVDLVNKEAELLTAVKSGSVNPYLISTVEKAVEESDIDFLASEIPQAIDQSLDGIFRVTEIVRAMKEFSHPGEDDKVATDINRAIQSTITVARNEWKYVSMVETDFDESLPLISCYPGEFNQVILNLITNAAHAIADTTNHGQDGKGRIGISTRLDGEWAEIRVSDTGTGIPENIRKRVFDPFFTTKDVGKGTGQGLAIAHSVIVDKHEGSITFESETGTGTTFILRLPVKPIVPEGE